MTRSIVWKLSGVMVPKIATGRPMTIHILNILLPMMLPTMRSVSLRLAAVIVVTSSGKDVPSAMIVREMTRSEMPMAEAMLEALLTTSWLPAMSPAKPMRVRNIDFPILCSGFSGFLALASRFLRAMAMR